MSDLNEKTEVLLELIRGYGSVLIAFSGGVDSTFLLAAARRALPRERVLAATGDSFSLASGELERCRSLTEELDVRLLEVRTEEFEDENYLSNPVNRCFFCKQELYSHLVPIAEREGIKVIVNGMNVDDLGDFRPGQQAAKAADVQSPLREAGFTKQDIREVSQAWGLPTWDRPESPCLSSRVTYGTAVAPALLAKIDRAENAVRALGFKVVRVRTDGNNARVEIGVEELKRALEETMQERLRRAVAEVGFDPVAIDPSGYRRSGKQESWALQTP